MDFTYYSEWGRVGGGGGGGGGALVGEYLQIKDAKKT